MPDIDLGTYGICVEEAGKGVFLLDEEGNLVSPSQVLEGYKGWVVKFTILSQPFTVGERR